MDFLGDIGGVTALLIEVVNFVLGGYLAYHSSIETMLSLYSYTREIEEIRTGA